MIAPVQCCTINDYIRAQINSFLAKLLDRFVTVPVRLIIVRKKNLENQKVGKKITVSDWAEFWRVGRKKKKKTGHKKKEVQHEDFPGGHPS